MKPTIAKPYTHVNTYLHLPSPTHRIILRRMEKQLERLNMRVSAEWLARIDAWRESQDFPPSRSDAVRLIVDRFIAADAARQPRQRLAKVE